MFATTPLAHAVKPSFLPLLLAGVLGWLLPQLALAWPVPDTGQTTSYYAGDDGSYSINPPSYTKLGANDVELPDTATQADGWLATRDNVTGLIWEMKTDDGGIHDKDNTYTWANSTAVFIKGVNDAKFMGHSDWRMPTVKELATLVQSVNANPAIDTTLFPGSLWSNYWSSTTDASNTGFAWYVDFSYGVVGNYSKSGSYAVRAVCGGQ